MSDTNNVADTIKQWILDSGADGLFLGEEECGCSVNHIAPCDGFQGRCALGKLLTCEEATELGFDVWGEYYEEVFVDFEQWKDLTEQRNA
jgi:hypothetical protein